MQNWLHSILISIRFSNLGGTPFIKLAGIACRKTSVNPYKYQNFLFVGVDQIRFQLQVTTSQLVRTTLNNDKNMLVISLFMLFPRKMRDRSQSLIHLNPKQRLPTAVPHKNVRGAPLPCKGVPFSPGVSYLLRTIYFLA